MWRVQIVYGERKKEEGREPMPKEDQSLEFGSGGRTNKKSKQQQVRGEEQG